jgi:DNA repair protein RecO (recombination protein O)
MQWQDEGYLLSKNNFDENSIIIDAFTQNHGKYTGIVYGGSSRKVKRNFQIGNKILINWKSKNENKMGYFSVELIEPVAPYFFDDKKRSICILAASSLLKILLPERQINKKIYESFDKLISDLKEINWIKLYIYWELSIIKELGFEVNFLNIDKNASNKTIQINGKEIKVPPLLMNNNSVKNTDAEINEALSFNKTLLLENIISPNRLKFPLSRNILEKYYN